MSIATPYPYSYMAKALLVDLGIDVPPQRRVPQPRRCSRSTVSAPACSSTRSTSAKTGSWPATADCRGTSSCQGAALGRRAARSGATLRQESRLHARQASSRRWRAGAHQLSGVPADAREDEPRRAAVLSRPGRPQQQARRHDTGARSGAAPDRSGSTGSGLPRGESFRQGSFTFHFPDGNASIARLLVSRLVPKAIPGTPRHVVDREAPPVAYEKLDAAGTPTRIRLNSTVTRVAVERPSRTRRRVAYLRDGRDAPGPRRERGAGLLQRAHPAAAARAAGRQKEALAYSVKVPMLYTNVLLRRWTPFKQLGVASINSPGCITRTPASTRDHHRRLSRRDHARRANRRAHGPQSEPAGTAAQGTEPPRPARAADDDVPRVRARDPTPVRARCSPAQISILPPTSSASR